MRGLLLILSIYAIGCISREDQPLQEEDLVGEVYFELKPSEETGVNFSNNINEKYENFFEFFAYIYNGGGVAIGDVNNDGLQDIYFTGNEVADRLYVNQSKFTFKDITPTAIKQGQSGWHNGVSMVDINADGWLDIYVCRGGWQDQDKDRTNLLYINQKDETFVESASEYGLDDVGYSMQAAFFDMDNDNDLDMYLISRPDSFYLPLTQMIAAKAISPDKNRDKLYRNDNGKFVEIGREAGIVNYAYSLGVSTADVNNDGYMDIFVANDYSTPDYLYINQGNGTFRDATQEAMNHLSLFSMGTDISDVNNDGMEDILVMEMRPVDYVRSKVSMPSMDVQGFNAVVDAGMHKQYMHNMLHLNQGNGHFSEVSQLAGISKTDWSWSCLSADFDADGNRDLFVTNGMRRDLFDGDVQIRLSQYIQENRAKFKTPQDLFGPGFKGIVDSYKPIKINNFIFQNEGNLHYKDKSEAWGINQSSFSNGAAIADLDNDGDLDIVVNNIDDPAFIFENKTKNNNSWLKIDLKGPKGNKNGIGAKVWVYAPQKMLYQQQKLVRGYLSSQDPHVFFGLGNTQQVDSVVVVWSDLKSNVITNPLINQTIEILYSDAVNKDTPKYLDASMFKELTASLLDKPYIHRENLFDEYKDQVLLPHRFSTAGPKLSFADINGDTVEDFYVGGSKGMAGVLYLSGGKGWTASKQPVFETDAMYEDMQSVFLDYDKDGDQDIFVVSGGSEYADGNENYQDRLYRNDNNIFVKVELPKVFYNGSAAIAEDFDGDGDLDIFVGGFVKPNQYPLSSKCYLLKNENGKFTDVGSNWLGVEGQDLGIVYDAISINIDGDPLNELVVAGEWTPIIVLDWDGSKFQNKTQEYGLEKTRGWWASLQFADMDGDGDQDIIAGNLGENYKFKVGKGSEFKVFANDFDGNGTNDIFLAKGSHNKLLPIRGKECSSQQMPDISVRFPTFQSFAQADIDQIIGTMIKSSINKEVDIFSSVILYNEGSNFTLENLPTAAQFSIINGIVASDFNKDGKTDLFVGGNRFDSEVETTPADASMGCLLLNDGERKFRSIAPKESGLYMGGDVKDIYLTTYRDKHVFFVSENKGPLTIWMEENQQIDVQ
ncbi:MAG: VCBS repeat-containing protein [Chitinophagales bacterium]